MYAAEAERTERLFLPRLASHLFVCLDKHHFLSDLIFRKSCFFLLLPKPNDSCKNPERVNECPREVGRSRKDDKRGRPSLRLATQTEFPLNSVRRSFNLIFVFLIIHSRKQKRPWGHVEKASTKRKKENRAKPESDKRRGKKGKGCNHKWLFFQNHFLFLLSFSFKAVLEGENLENQRERRIGS